MVQSHDKSQSQEVVGHMNELIGENGVISSQGLSEISQILSLYRLVIWTSGYLTWLYPEKHQICLEFFKNRLVNNCQEPIGGGGG